MTLPEPTKAYLVLRWFCSHCGHMNHAEGKMMSADDPDAQAYAEAEGCEPTDCARVSDVLCCSKCETAHRMNPDPTP